MIGRGRDAGRPTPPAQIRTGTLMHTALTLDVWRQSELRDKDVERAEVESSGHRTGESVPATSVYAGCDAPE